jgi:formamidopyrimidine-DNA glycosylase
MPELPDLLYITQYLQDTVVGRRITAVRVKQSVVLRVAISQSVETALSDITIRDVSIHGPFIHFALSRGIDLVIHLMFMGRLQHQRPGEPSQAYLCVSFDLDDRTHLNLCDEQKRAKCYVVPHGSYGVIPSYEHQGIDILSPGFTLDVFRNLTHQHTRKQVRSFLNDHAALSSIGNAYADEILFEAQLHPKTFVGRLSAVEVERLFTSIHRVMDQAIHHVQAARQPIHVKVRDHMRVRMQKGEPCPRCGEVIRREGVRGFDVYFCPQCQPPSRKHFIDWRRV